MCRLAAQLAEREELNALLIPSVCVSAAGARVSTVVPARNGCGALSSFAGQSSVGSAVVPVAPSFVGLRHIERASQQLRGSASIRCAGITATDRPHAHVPTLTTPPRRYLIGLPVRQLLILCCMVFQQRKTGRAHVGLEILLGHHTALSRRHGSVSPATPSEQHEVGGVGALARSPQYAVRSLAKMVQIGLWRQDLTNPTTEQPTTGACGHIRAPPLPTAHLKAQTV